jgi:formylglycine-generating enzyme required for sulfatase activity
MPGREFTMGSPAAEAGRGDDEAATALAVRGFWMDANEVSNRAFKRFVDAVPEWQKGKVARASADESYLKTWTGASFPAGEGDQPVVWVSWHAAAAYAKWAGKRLPTEAEWEFAARAGTSTPYWWGDVFDEAHANAGPQLRAVGDAASRNKWGLTDMLGNVWEWTASLSRPYPYRTDDGRDDPQGTGARAVRGGAAGYGVQFLRSADRNAAAPDLTSARLGFRCAR